MAGARSSSAAAAAATCCHGRSSPIDSSATPLARSFAGYLEYWERYAETWEFQSLLRARHVAGDEALGRRFCSFAADFAYPEYLPVERALEIRRMRERVEKQRVKPPEASRFHVKLGYGSLADVQFAVEMLLLRNGAPSPRCARPAPSRASSAWRNIAWSRARSRATSAKRSCSSTT